MCPIGAVLLAGVLADGGAAEAPGPALALYLEGRRLWARRTAADLTRAEERFGRALELDPDFAPAHSGLADVFALRSDWARARSETLRALELDPDLAEAHASLGFIRLHADWDRPGSEEALARALGLDPGLPQGHLWRAIALEVAGRHGEAVAAAQRALSLAPDWIACRAALGYRLYWARRYAEAIRALETALELDPESTSALYFVGRSHVELGHHPEAVAVFARARALAPRDLNLLAAEAYAAAVAGRPGPASAALLELERWVERGYALASQVAGLHAALGRREDALRWLERAAERRETPLLWLAADPRFDPLREEPRFRKLVEDLGLPGRRPQGR